MRTRAPAEPSASARGLSVWGAAYLRDLQRRNHSEGSKTQARQVLGGLFAFLAGLGVRDVRQVGEEHLVGYLAMAAARPGRRKGLLSESSRATHTSVLRCFFSFLERRGAILVSPAQGLRLRRVRPLPRAVPTEANVRALLETPPETATGLRDRAILELLYGTGVRIGECARVDLGDLDLDVGELLVRNGKGRKDRLVPVPRRAAEVVRGYLREVRPSLVHDEAETALFLSCFGTRLRKGTLYVIFKGHARAAGLGISPHGLRHAYATHLLARGADVRHLQQLLGHARLDTTAIYTRVGVEDLAAVLRRAHPRGRPSGEGT